MLDFGLILIRLNNRPSSRGFTLIELMVSVAIISILSFVSIPIYKKYKRQAAQSEAKNNLSLVYQSQKSHYATDRKLNENLKELGALASGKLRYNVGGDWSGGGVTAGFHGYSDSDHCGGSCSTSNTDDPCCMEVGTSATTPCYGGAITNIRAKINAVKSAAVTVNADTGNMLNNSQFTFFALGCTGFDRSATTELDVWSIDERSFLNNLINGAS